MEVTQWSTILHFARQIWLGMQTLKIGTTCSGLNRRAHKDKGNTFEWLCHEQSILSQDVQSRTGFCQCVFRTREHDYKSKRPLTNTRLNFSYVYEEKFLDCPCESSSLEITKTYCVQCHDANSNVVNVTPARFTIDCQAQSIECTYLM